MKNRPIVFAAESVRAILEGRKTQTRRMVKLPRSMAGGDLENATPTLIWGMTPGLLVPMPDDTTQRFRNPWGWHSALPVRLWVKEVYAPRYFSGTARELLNHDCTAYRADWKPGNASYCPEPKWKSPLFMPRADSRITLEITGVRVERLQDITEADAAAEGCDGNCPIGYIPAYQAGPLVYHYAQVWDKINGKKPGCDWAANPFVWRLEFKVVQP